MTLVVSGEGGERAASWGRRQEVEGVAVARAGAPQHRGADGTGRLWGQVSAVDPVEWIVDGATWCTVTADRLLMQVKVVKVLQVKKGIQNFIKRNFS